MELLKFSEKLREAMTACNITQKQLADHLGTTQQTVSRWLNSVNEPDLTSLLKICLFLGETPNSILGYDDISDNVISDSRYFK